jgi:hypothetical protein
MSNAHAYMLMLMLLRAHILVQISTMLILMNKICTSNNKFNNDHLSELLVHTLKPVEEAQESHDTKARVEVASSSPNRVHAQLRDTAVDGSDTRSGAQHGTNSAARSRVVPDLEDLQFGANLVRAALHDSRRDRVGGHVAVGVGRDDDTDVQAWRVILEVCVEEVGVDGVDDVG